MLNCKIVQITYRTATRGTLGLAWNYRSYLSFIRWNFEDSTLQLLSLQNEQPRQEGGVIEDSANPNIA